MAQFAADLLTFTEEILDGKLHSFCKMCSYFQPQYFQITSVFSHHLENEREEQPFKVISLRSKITQDFKEATDETSAQCANKVCLCAQAPLRPFCWNSFNTASQTHTKK